MSLKIRQLDNIFEISVIMFLGNNSKIGYSDYQAKVKQIKQYAMYTLGLLVLHLVLQLMSPDEYLVHSKT